jgi:hypothetical protein
MNFQAIRGLLEVIVALGVRVFQELSNAVIHAFGDDIGRVYDDAHIEHT